MAERWRDRRLHPRQCRHHVQDRGHRGTAADGRGRPRSVPHVRVAGLDRQRAWIGVRSGSRRSAQRIHPAHAGPTRGVARSVPEPHRRGVGSGARTSQDDQFDLQRRPVLRHPSGRAHYMLMEGVPGQIPAPAPHSAGEAITDPADPTGRGWGTYIFDAEPQRALSFSAPHLHDDLETEHQAIEAYLASRARTLLIAGTDRDQNTTDAPCAQSQRPYKESDVSHTAECVFQIAFEEIYSSDAPRGTSSSTATRAARRTCFSAMACRIRRPCFRRSPPASRWLRRRRRGEGA